MKKALMIVCVLIVCVSMFVGDACAQWRPFVVPRNGQTPEQQATDVAEAEAFARQQTGVDPAYIQGQLSMMQQQQSVQGHGTGYGTEGAGRTLARGALRGAALGGIEKNVRNDVGRMAAQGAVIAGARRRDAAREDQVNQAVSANNAQIAQLENQLNDYKRAFTAFLDARGYSVQ